jgi:hypothetical protein
MKNILSAFLLLAIHVCHAQTESKTDPNTEWETFKCEKYSISYPSGWGTDTSRQMGVDLFIFSQPDSVGDKFRENVNVLSSNVEGLGITLDSFVNTSLKGIKSMATDFNIVESKLYKTGDKVYHKIDFTARQGIFTLHFVQYYFATATTLYTATLTTEVSRFNQYKAIGIKILDSFVPLK